MFYNNYEKKRLAAAATGLILLLSMLLSSLFIAVEVEHDCVGEDCSVCACIHMCETVLAGGAPVAMLVLLYVLSTFSDEYAHIYEKIFVRESPITQKVRQNN